MVELLLPGRRSRGLLVGWLAPFYSREGCLGAGGGFLRTDFESVNRVGDAAEDVSCEFWRYGHGGDIEGGLN